MGAFDKFFIRIVRFMAAAIIGLIFIYSVIFLFTTLNYLIWYKKVFFIISVAIGLIILTGIFTSLTHNLDR